MSGARDMAALAGLAGAAREGAEARLRALGAEAAAIRARIAAIEDARRARAGAAVATDVSLRAGVDLRWEAWAEARVRALTSDLLRVLARQEDARDALRRAFGRSVAADALADRARALDAARRLKREERG